MNRIVVVLPLLFAGLAQAASVEVDPTFGNGGRLDVPDRLAIALLLADGRVLYTTDMRTEYSRTDVDGRPDRSFGTAGRASLPGGFRLDYRTRARRTPSGQVYLNGSAVLNPTVTEPLGTGAVLRLLGDGRVDETFGNRGVAETAVLGPVGFMGSITEDLLPLRAGGLIAFTATYESYYDSARSLSMHRLDEAGTPVPGFEPGGNGAPGALVLRSPNDPYDYEYSGDVLRLLRSDVVRVRVGPRREYSTLLGKALPPPVPEILLHPRIADWERAGVLPGGYELVLGNDIGPSGFDPSNALVVGRLRPDGSVDAAFNRGATTRRLSLADLRAPFAVAPLEIQAIALSPDLRTLVVAVGLVGQDRRAVRLVRMIVEGADAGLLDPTFGDAGVASLFDGGDQSVQDLVVQPDGSLVVALAFGDVLRLSGRDQRGPGLLYPVASSLNPVEPTDGAAVVRVNRSAGSTGMASLDYRTSSQPGPYGAVPGEDFTSVSGRLVWADGDAGEKVIRVPLVAGARRPVPRSFEVVLDNPVGGLLSGRSTVYVTLAPSAPAPPAASAPAASLPVAPAASTGGGGLLDPLLLLTLGLLLHLRLLSRRGR